MDSLIQKIPSNVWKTVGTISAASAAIIFLKLTLTSLRERKKEFILEKWVNVAQVQRLIIYPVKSCQGIEVSEAEVTPLGLKASKYLRDRAFLIVNSNGVFQTQRQHPTMATIKIEIENDVLIFSAPGVENITLNMDTVQRGGEMKTCRIWFDHLNAIDCGDLIGKWIDNFLNQSGHRLFYHISSEGQRNLTSSSGCNKFPNFTRRDLGIFHDDTAYMLMAEESIAVLNTKLESPVNYQSFRPVILIDGLREAFSEDFWTFIRFGDKEIGPTLKTCIPCSRCRVTTVDQKNGVFNLKGEPLKTLHTLQRKVGDKETNELVQKNAVLGTNFGLFDGNGSIIKIGDSVYAALI